MNVNVTDFRQNNVIDLHKNMNSLIKWFGLSTLVGIAPPPCMDQCDRDPNATSLSYNTKTKECVLGYGDPATSFVEDPDWVLYVKRPAATGPSSWSDWYPKECPKCGTDVVMRRMCSGPRCVGSSERPCSLPKCNLMNKVGEGYLVPEYSYSGKAASVFAKTEADCAKACLGDEACRGASFNYVRADGLGNTCLLYKGGEDKRPLVWLGEPIPSIGIRWPIVFEKVPDDGSKWGPMPRGPCNTGYGVPRKCESKAECSVGYDKLMCS